ncbi:glycosyltransferase family 4 protein [Mariniblastus sp.]|nr:glycosyltransferase family 4 protein [Mariniblastus sp.]
MSSTLVKSESTPTVNAIEFESPDYTGQVLDAHVVILNNYLRLHHAVSYVELAKRVRKLTVLLSVPMEPNKDWEAEWLGLDVKMQKNWMITKKWKHSKGFAEDIYIHLPMDTVKQLKQLKPDIVFSYEMGVRTLLSGWFRKWNRKVPLVMVGNMSENIECERRLGRRLLRSVVKRLVDCCTYNGPSCKRYLKSIGLREEQLHHLPYCIDPKVVYRGKRELIPAGEPRKLLYCGGIIARKGVIEFTTSLKKWCQSNPQRKVVLQLAGAGDEGNRLLEMQGGNLTVELLGDLDQDALRLANRDADICVNPTFADEWGLVPIEALASGIPVLGSFYAQSVEAVIEEGRNGWVFKTDDVASMDKAIAAAMACTNQELFEMQDTCRESVAHISPTATAESFCDIIRHALK